MLKGGSLCYPYWEMESLGLLGRAPHLPKNSGYLEYRVVGGLDGCFGGLNGWFL